MHQWARFNIFVGSTDSGLSATSASLPPTLSWVVQLTSWREGMSSSGTWTALRDGTVKTSWGSTRPSAPGLGQSQAQAQAGQRMDWEQPLGEELGGVGGHEPQHKVCPHFRKPNLSWAESRERPAGQGRRSCPATLVGSGPWKENTFHVLKKEKSRGGHEDDHNVGAPLLWRKAERIGILESVEEKALGRPYRTFQYWKGVCKRGGEWLFIRPWSDSTSDSGFNLTEGRFRLDIGKKFFTVKLLRPWQRFPRVFVSAPSLEVLKTRLGRAWSNLG